MTDELVFKKAQNGDKQSLYKLIKPIEKKLYKAAYAYVGNEADALDCVHDGIVKAIRNIKNLNDGSKFNAWISRIVVNSCKDFIKKNSKSVLVDIQDYSNQISYNDKNFEDEHEIYEALQKLSEKDREIIVLRYLDDKTLNEIAVVKEIPIGTVKSRLSRALKKMKICFGGVD